MPEGEQRATQHGGDVVDIPFNDWSSERHRRGEKTATTRTKKYGEPGDCFEDAGKTYELTHVVRLPLRIVAEEFFRQEGAESTGAFVEVWNDIHYKRGYDPDWNVYLHLYREVDG